jgi:uncharacterized protein (DUF1800 family)
MLLYLNNLHSLAFPDFGASVQRRSASVCASLFVLAFVASAALTGCNSLSLGDSSSFTAISAPASFLRVNQTMQLITHSQFNGIPLVFSVNGIKGGNDVVGTIDANGLYTAPAIVPNPYTVTITSAATEYPNAPPGKVSLAVWNPIPILNTVTPSAFSEGNTQITVAGSQFVYGATIVWNGAELQTTPDSNNQVSASVAGVKQGTYTLLVRNPNPGSADSQTVNVVVGPGQPVLTLDLGEGTDVRVNNSLNIGVQVNGTIDTGVILQVNGVPANANGVAGNATVGTAVSNTDGSITYTAPAVVPTLSSVDGLSNVVSLTITSHDKNTVFTTVNLSILNPIPILTGETSPASFTLNTQTPITLTGQDFIPGATVLVNGSSFNSSSVNSAGTQLTANVTVSDPGNIDVQVVNPIPGPAASADLILPATGTLPTNITLDQASRFLQQATFGATDADIHHLQQIGYDAWFTEQFSAPQTSHEQLVEQSILLNPPACTPSANTDCSVFQLLANSSDEIYFQNSFWQQAITGNDQLRQRMKYTLSEIFVISGTNVGVQEMPRGEAKYYDMLGSDAFGTFPTLLKDVTLSPAMGQFLSMLGNDKGDPPTTDPDENYAREVMQLFTIGLWKLNPDGTQAIDSTTNLPQPTYSNTDVEGLAQVFTGFSWDSPAFAPDVAWYSCCIDAVPGAGQDLSAMISYDSHHSTGTKTFLSTSTSSDADTDLAYALNVLFTHPNLPPFFCKQLIQHLVTSNPSPAYVQRVATVFTSTGGDMQAVIKAVLMDQDALDPAADAASLSYYGGPALPYYGKVREALVRYTEWARAFSAQSRNGSYYSGSTEDPIYGLGEMTLRSPTVFNWFAPGYIPPGTSISAANLVAPEMQMTDVSTVVGFLNYMQNAIGATPTQGPDIFSNYAEEIKIADNSGALLDRINLLLMAGEMDSGLYSQIQGAVNAIVIPASGDANAARLARVETAIYLTMFSPSYSAQY